MPEPIEKTWTKNAIDNIVNQLNDDAKAFWESHPFASYNEQKIASDPDFFQNDVQDFALNKACSLSDAELKDWGSENLNYMNAALELGLVKEEESGSLVHATCAKSLSVIDNIEMGLNSEKLGDLYLIEALQIADIPDDVISNVMNSNSGIAVANGEVDFEAIDSLVIGTVTYVEENSLNQRENATEISVSAETNIADDNNEEEEEKDKPSKTKEHRMFIRPSYGDDDTLEKKLF